MTETTAPLWGRHALVTGASRGIGAAIAASLATDGARVTLVGRDAARLAEVSARLAGPDRAAPIVADVTQASSVRDAFVNARRQFGPVHILVNNAGQAASATFANTDEALWNRLLAVNLTGTYLCSREAVADMLEAGFGRIVNIASIAGLRGAAYISAYAASKHGVIGLTRSLALEYATRNITVNAICPGYTDTDMVRQAVDNIRAKTGRSEAEALGAITATNPQRRLITPAEVSNSVLWLCRPGTESVTGQSIVIAGGEVT
ncbi:MAG: SDR family oxidoreductase [Gammaproteobacteria bacterium]|nr:SDR family oxidoreductase [Gammaproteobacteria bacterium]